MKYVFLNPILLLRWVLMFITFIFKSKFELQKTNKWNGIRVTKWNKRKLSLRQRISKIMPLNAVLVIISFCAISSVISSCPIIFSLLVMSLLATQNPQLSGCESPIFNAI
jgi:hypothetical protein